MSVSSALLGNACVFVKSKGLKPYHVGKKNNFKGNNLQNYLSPFSLLEHILKVRICSLTERIQILGKEIPAYKSGLPLKDGCKIPGVYLHH